MMRKALATLSAATVLVLVLAAPADAATARHRLRNVAVPAYCQMPRQHLRNGVTQTKYLPRQGQIDYYLTKPILVHLKQSGTQLLAQYGCTAGGVGWPEVLVLYSKHNKLLASLRLERYAPHSEHAQVTKWKRKGHTVKVWWVDYQGAGFDIHHHQSTLRLRHGKLVLA